MNFAIRMGIPEMLRLWNSLKQKRDDGKISKSELALYKKWGKAMKLLSQDPFYPGLHTHEIDELSARYGQKVWQSYLEINTSRAMRLYWVYGSERGDITVIGLELHPEDRKHGAYEKIVLSEMPKFN